MIGRFSHAELLAGAAAFMLTATTLPASGQWIVFDPTNYAQNVLTAARELQQVNHDIQMIENQAASLINQARNLASLPYSVLSQLEQQINQTQQLLAQAQHIAYSVSTIDQAFTQIYPQTYSGSTSSQQLLAGAEIRWQNARAGFPGRYARPGRHGDQSRLNAHADRCIDYRKSGRHWRASSGPVWQSARRF